MKKKICKDNPDEEQDLEGGNNLRLSLSNMIFLTTHTWTESGSYVLFGHFYLIIYSFAT